MIIFDPDVVRFCSDFPDFTKVMMITWFTMNVIVNKTVKNRLKWLKQTAPNVNRPEWAVINQRMASWKCDR